MGWVFVSDFFRVISRLRESYVRANSTVKPSHVAQAARSPIAWQLAGIKAREDQAQSTERPSILSNKSEPLLYLPEEEFRNILKSFIERCVQANTTLSIRAASNIAAEIGDYSIIERMKDQWSKFKLTTLVKKEKWMIASQVIMLM